jgi:hypothetical protein
MKLCFVPVNGPRETYLLDEPRIHYIIYYTIIYVCFEQEIQYVELVREFHYPVQFITDMLIPHVTLIIYFYI